MGNITEIMHAEKRNYHNVLEKLDKDRYIDKRTGEVKEYNHSDSRQDNISSVKKSLGRLRDYINTNVTDVAKCKWITLTYKENMKDTERLTKDFKRFLRLFRKRVSECEYIIACEPQARGAWHIHAIIIFKENYGYLSNEIVQELWGNGFTKTQALKDIDNIGAYLTAYLGDIDLNIENLAEYANNRDAEKMQVKEVITNGMKKKYIKGGRLHLFPVGFNLYRKSNGIRPPTIKRMKYNKKKCP